MLGGVAGGAARLHRRHSRPPRLQGQPHDRPHQPQGPNLGIQSLKCYEAERKE